MYVYIYMCVYVVCAMCMDEWNCSYVVRCCAQLHAWLNCIRRLCIASTVWSEFTVVHETFSTSVRVLCTLTHSSSDSVASCRFVHRPFLLFLRRWAQNFIKKAHTHRPTTMHGTFATMKIEVRDPILPLSLVSRFYSLFRFLFLFFSLLIHSSMRPRRPILLLFW